MPSLRTHGFFPHWFQREAVPKLNLNASDQLVFYAICGQMDNHGVSRASQRMIEDRTGLARSTVKASLTRLQKHHLIEKTWPAGIKSASQYVVAELMPSTIPAPTVRDERQIRERRRA